ncbi:MAG: CDP-alcohol phosphatidyltransferase family protein [Thermodesulfobacteriota bacterium]
MNNFIRFVPNTLSISRIFFALYFPFAPQTLWLPLVLVSGFSDFLDGWIARRYQVQSWQGSLLDGIGDKLFVLCVLITFVAAGKISGWWLPLLLARDLLVAGIAAYAAAIHSWEAFRKMEARLSGKLATGGQFLFFLTTILFPAGIYPALAIAVCLSVTAAVDYGRLFLAEQQVAKKKT